MVAAYSRANFGHRPLRWESHAPKISDPGSRSYSGRTSAALAIRSRCPGGLWSNRTPSTRLSRT